MSRGNTLCFPLAGKHECPWHLDSCRDCGLPARPGHRNARLRRVSGGRWKWEAEERPQLTGGASVLVSGPRKRFHAEVPKGKRTNTEAMSLVSAAADRSQTKLLSSSHLTTDYTRLILSFQFERTIITPWLILPLNILCSDWQAVAVGSAGKAASMHGVRMKLQRSRDGCHVLRDGLWPQVGLEEVQEVHRCSPAFHIYPDLSSFKGRA